jgi:hypothetical protein
MKKVEDYRRHAQDCRLMANRSRSPEERGMLTNMAQTWDSLAVNCEEHIARTKRMAALEPPQRRDGSIPIDELNAPNDD